MSPADRVAADLLANGPATALQIARRTGMHSNSAAAVWDVVRHRGGDSDEDNRQ